MLQNWRITLTVNWSLMRMVDFTYNSIPNVMTDFHIVDFSYLNTNISGVNQIVNVEKFAKVWRNNKQVEQSGGFGSP